jgi:hypothetical protein
MTFIFDRALVSWNVRTIPERATLYDGIPDRLVPLKDQCPSSG